MKEGKYMLEVYTNDYASLMKHFSDVIEDEEYPCRLYKNVYEFLDEDYEWLLCIPMIFDKHATVMGVVIKTWIMVIDLFINLTFYNNSLYYKFRKVES